MDNKLKDAFYDGLVTIMFLIFVGTFAILVSMHLTQQESLIAQKQLVEIEADKRNMLRARIRSGL